MTDEYVPKSHTKELDLFTPSWMRSFSRVAIQWTRETLETIPCRLPRAIPYRMDREIQKNNPCPRIRSALEDEASGGEEMASGLGLRRHWNRKTTMFAHI